MYASDSYLTAIHSLTSYEILLNGIAVALDLTLANTGANLLSTVPLRVRVRLRFERRISPFFVQFTYESQQKREIYFFLA